MTTVPARTRSAGLGVAALILAIVAPVWLFAGIYTAAAAVNSDSPVLGVIGAVLVGGGFIVPVAFIAGVVLGIVAIVVGNRRGKVLGGVALVVSVLSIALVIVFVAVSFGAFGAPGTFGPR